MSREDWTAYARQVVLPEVGVNGQALLADSTVLVAGLGGLGTVAAAYLARAGLGRLLLVDRDRVALSNLHRQLLYTRDDLGRPKVQAAVAALRAANPEVQLDGFDEDVESEALQSRVLDADLVLDCTDNFPARFALNAACVRARRPLVTAAAVRLEAQLAVFDLRAAASPCYACLYPSAGPAAEACEDAGILGPVVGVAGALQALAALKLLLGIADETGMLLRWDARRGAWRKARITPEPECPVCGGAR